MARARYPHLLSKDVPIWERWLDLHGDAFETIEYDVRVGDGRDPGEAFEPNIRDMALDLSRRRIDAVAHTPTEITVIEITTEAGLKALGQVTAYPILYRQTYNPTLPVRALLVCETLETDVEPALKQHNIAVDVV